MTQYLLLLFGYIYNGLTKTRVWNSVILFDSATAPGSLSRSVSQSSLGSAKFNPSSGSETDSMDSMVEKLSIESDSGVVLREKVLTRGFSQR